MGNIITFGKDDFKMSNGLTDVLIDYMLISGSELAKTHSEERLIAFLAECDQSYCGLGVVGFDISEMPWDKESFAADKQFMLDAVKHARELTYNKDIWDMLMYEPNHENIEYALDGFERLISAMSETDIREDILKEWFHNRGIWCGWVKCRRHDTIMSICGCKFCGDGCKDKKK
jgi:hypothetical protein